MRRNRAKKIILNPVLQIPWIAQFRDFEKVAQLESFVLNLSLDNDDVQDLCVPKRIPRRYVKIPVRPTKADLTRIYTDQIKPNYPNFTKTHVRAALMLTDNNLEEARIILDLKGRFEKIKKQRKPLPLVKKCTQTLEVSGPALNFSSTVGNPTNTLQTTRFTEKNDRIQSGVPNFWCASTTIAPLGSFPGVQGISAISTIPSFVDTPMSTPNSEEPLNTNSDTTTTPSLKHPCISDFEVKNSIYEAQLGETPDTSPSVDFKNNVLSTESSKEDTTLATLEANENNESEGVYDYGESDNDDSSLSFSEWKMSKTGSSKIILKRNKVGVQILKKSYGYISTLL